MTADTSGSIVENATWRGGASANPGAPAASPPVAGGRPGTGAWVNYDFVPGDMVLFYDDYMDGRVGDFPRRFEVVDGNWEVVEWQGGRFIRATANGAIAVSLPATLPARFTMEFPASVQHGNASCASARLTCGNTGDRRRPSPTARGGCAPKGTRDDHRVANAPNAVLPRTNTLYLTVAWASDKNPIMIGPMRIAAGGLDLYDRLERDGRAATHGILFAIDSDVIRPESTPTLTEIGTMLKSRPDLRLAIEGHTDNQGDDAHNQDLSNRRAQAVKAYLVSMHEVDAGRLQTAGFGEGQPVADNGSPEGRAQTAGWSWCGSRNGATHAVGVS